MNTWVIIVLLVTAYFVGHWIGTKIVLFFTSQTGISYVNKHEASRMAGFMHAAAGLTGAIQGFIGENPIVWAALFPLDYLLVRFGARKILGASSQEAHRFSLRYTLIYFIPVSLFVSLIVKAITAKG